MTTKPRSQPQNRIFHAICGEVAKQAMFAGRKRSAQQWKVLLISGHSIATEGECPELATGLEGEIISLRESTAKMTVERMTSLIEYCNAWAALNGVELQK